MLKNVSCKVKCKLKKCKLQTVVLNNVAEDVIRFLGLVETTYGFLA